MTRKIKSHIARTLMVLALFVLLMAAVPLKTEAAETSLVSLRGEKLKNDYAWHSYNDSGAQISGWTAGQYRLSTNSSVLELKNFTFYCTVDEVDAIYSEGPLNIVATGTNNISCKGTGLFADGIGSLTMSGSGSVNVTCTSDDDVAVFLQGVLNVNSGTLQATNLAASSYNVVGGTVRVSDYLVANESSETSVISEGLVTVTGSTAFQGALELKGSSLNTGLTAGSVYCVGDLTQTGGSLNTNKGSVDIDYGNYTGSGGSLISAKSIYVYHGDMQIGGAIVRATAGVVKTSGNLEVSAGSLRVDKYGISVGKNLNISDTGAIDTALFDSDDTSVQAALAALDVSEKLIADGGTILATSSSIEGFALRVSGETDINGGTVTVKLENSDAEAFAASFGGPVYLQGGKLTVTDASDFSAMYCRSSIQINNDAVLEVTGIGGFGLSVRGGFTLNSGTAIISSGSSVALSTNTFKMNGGKLVLNGGTNSRAWRVAEGVTLADDIWMSEPSDGKYLDTSGSYYYILNKDGSYVSRAVLQKVSSISVGTAPGGELYSGDGYDAEQLVLNVKFEDGSVSALSYATHIAMFGLNPAPTQALDAGTHTVSVTCLTKTTSFDVTVKEMGKSVLTGTATTNSHSLRWTAADGASWYDLYGKKQGESSYSVLVSSNVSGYTKGDLPPGETWEYYVVPVGESTLGAEVYGPESDHLTLTTLPEPPVISVSGSSYDSASLEWEESAGAEAYEVFRSSDGENFEEIARVEDTAFTDTGLVTGREYTYYVKADIPDKDVYSDKSNRVKVTPKFTGTTTLEVKNTGKYELSWSAADGATGYEIMRGNGADGSRTLLKTVDAETTSCTDDSADIYSVYNYTVVPVRTTEEGTFRGTESNVAVTKASKRPEPVPPDNEEPEGIFNLLQARSGKVTKTSIQIKWKKVPGAKRYILYGNKCGIKNKYKKLTVTTGSKMTYKKVAGKKIKKGTYYKFVIYALDANGEVLSTSKVIHVATTGGKVGNDKSVKTAARKNKVTLKKGKSFSLKAKAIPASRKLKVNRHRKVKYETSDRKIATVTSKGVIKAKGKGTCYVYAYAQNGVFAKIRVTVK